MAALPVEDLYVAEVFVTNQSDAQLKSGARAGLLQVLIRVSGTEEVEQSSLIANALRNPDVYYYQYSYQSTDKEFTLGDETVPARILKLYFEPNAIAQLLRQAGFPVWGSNRPGILLWLALSDEDGRRILSESDESPLIESLQEMAKARGLPLLFPILDLEDQAALSTAEVWGAFLEQIDNASVRYNPDSVLTGRIEQAEGGQWTANWSFRIENEWQNRRSIAFSANDLVADVLSPLADELADRYAIDSSRGSVTLRIEAIDSVADYAAALAYLQSLTPVLDTFVVEVEDNEVVFRLATEGQVEQLVELIELDKKLVQLGGSEVGATLNYRWLE